MASLLREAGADWLSVVISRADVESSTLRPTLNVLESVLADAETVRLFQGRVDIGFEGWENDPRELYEIPEVCGFLKHIDAEWPYWLYYLSTELGTLRMIAFCLCGAKRAGPGVARIPPGALGGFLISHFNGLNKLFVDFGLEESVNRRITELVVQYFAVA